MKYIIGILIINGLVFIFQREAILVSIIITVLYSMYIVIVEYIRKKKMITFIKNIDNVLIGKENIDIIQFREGELSILQDKVNKLTIMLRE